MRPVWLLAGCAIAVLVLTLAVLEIVGGRVRVEPLSAVSDPGDEARDSWQVVPLTARENAGAMVEMEVGSAPSVKPPAEAVAAESAPSARPPAEAVAASTSDGSTEESRDGREHEALLMPPIHPASQTR
jgi:hypothetical protein